MVRHLGKRPSVTRGRKLPKRGVCPECGKKGVTQWKVTAHGDLRECQFCRASWGRAGWGAALARFEGRGHD